VHRDSAVGFFLAVLAGGVAHAGIAGLEALIPGIAVHHLDPFFRLIPAALAALLAIRGSQGSPLSSVIRATLAAGLSSLAGMAVSLSLGQPGPGVLPPLVSATGTATLLGLTIGAAVAIRAARATRRSGEVPPLS